MNTTDIEPLFYAERIHARVSELARQIDADLGDKDPLVLLLLDGSFIFVADLLRSINPPLRYEFVHTQYSGDREDPELLEIRFPLRVDIADEVVLLVKDVVDTGVTETYLRSQLEQRGAREVRIAALIDMPSQRKSEVLVDYRGFETERQGILVGYGMKCEGRYGNLPFIGRLAAPKEAGILE